MNVSFSSAKVRVRTGFDRIGSVRQGTVKGWCTGVISELDIESADDPAQVAQLITVAKGGCFVEGALMLPVEVESIVRLNGTTLVEPANAPG